MALAGTGQLSLSNIEGEFGGSPPTSLSEYYRGGGLVTSNNTGVPVSGQISLTNFYGAGALLTMHEQVLTGSGTFTPQYAGAKAIIQIGGGGGSGGYFVQGYDTSYPYGGRNGNAGAGDAIFVSNINDFSGGNYSVGTGGGGVGGCYVSASWGYGNYGTSSSFSSASNSPWSIIAGRGGRGGYGGSYPSAASNPMSGSYPTSTSGLPSQVLLDGVITDTSSYIALSAGGGGGVGRSAQVTRPPEGGSIAGCAFGGTGGAGFLRIYYLVE